MKQTTWSDWETRPPAQFAVLARIADYYQVSADYLLGLTDDPTPAQAGAALPEPVREVVGLLAYCTPATQARAAELIRSLVEQDQEAAARRQQEWNRLLHVLIELVGPGVAQEVERRLVAGEPVSLDDLQQIAAGLARPDVGDQQP